MTAVAKFVGIFLVFIPTAEKQMPTKDNEMAIPP